MKILPTPYHVDHDIPDEEDVKFDNLDTIAQAEELKDKHKHSKSRKIVAINIDVENQSSSSTKPQRGLGNRIKPKLKKYDQKSTKIKDTQRLSIFAAFQQLTFREYVEVFLINKSSRQLGAPFLALGLFFNAILEVIQSSFRYNITIFLVLAMASLYHAFPTNSVRAQLCISVATLLSFVFDIMKIANKFKQEPGIITLVVFQMFCKAIVFNAFLRNTKGGSRTRKYLDRRLRLFFIPLHQPKRIMRDVRARFLALGWIQLFAVLAYVLFLLVFVVYFDYAILLLSNQSGASMPIFLLIKTITSLLVFGGILYDTDVRLALFYFGCFGFNVDYIRKYIVRRRIELDGWPLAFSYYGLRFYLLSFVKLVDVMWGFYGWYLIGSNYLKGFLRIESSLQIFLTFLIYTMILTDIWCPILFFGIRWLLKRHKKMREKQVEYVSDDSEIEEFHLREDLEPYIEEDKSKEENRKRRLEDNLEALELAEQEKVTLLRKPSRADAVRIKGLKAQKGMKRNAILPINVMEKSEHEIQPEDVLDNPDDEYDTNMLAKDKASNPMQASSSSSEEDEKIVLRKKTFAEKEKEEDVTPASLMDRKDIQPSRAMSPIEFSELWEIFAVKEVSKETYAMLSLSKYFHVCAELSDIREFIKSPVAIQRTTLLRTFITHLQYVGVNIMSAGIHNQVEISVLCYKVIMKDNARLSNAANPMHASKGNTESLKKQMNADSIVVLMEIKFIPIDVYLLSKKNAADVVPFNAEYVIDCKFRANSWENSKLGMRFIQLDRLCTIL